MSKIVYFPKPEEQFNHWTSVPNVFFDEIQRKLDSYEWGVLCVFLRKLYGFHKDCDRIALSQLCRLTGYNHQTVLKRLKLLKERGIIIELEKGKSGGKNSLATLWKLNVGISWEIL